jgi:hypothetical protein
MYKNHFLITQFIATAIGYSVANKLLRYSGENSFENLFSFLAIQQRTCRLFELVWSGEY